jgi:hypothetical protein
MNSPATSPDSLLAATGQARKLYVAGLLFFGGLAITAVRHLPALADAPLTTIVIAGLGSLVAIGGALVALYGIRCPSCSLRWMWWSLKTQPYTRWLFWLQEFNSCPKCSLSASDGSVKQPNKSLERTREG